jgi:hypothetical protein
VNVLLAEGYLAADNDGRLTSINPFREIPD